MSKPKTIFVSLILGLVVAILMLPTNIVIGEVIHFGYLTKSKRRLFW